jgi:hypothetical protein
MCAERGKGVGLHPGEREEASVAMGKGPKPGSEEPFHWRRFRSRWWQRSR